MLDKPWSQCLFFAFTRVPFRNQVILPDMNFGSPPEEAPGAQSLRKKFGDASGTSADTEDVSPPDSAGPGSPPYVLPLTPRNVGLEAMEEEEEGGGEEAASSHPQVEGGNRRGEESGRKRKRVVGLESTAALDLGSFAAGGVGGTARWVFYRRVLRLRQGVGVASGWLSRCFCLLCCLREKLAE